MRSTLLNFEILAGRKNAKKAREIFSKGHVIELHKAKKIWVARIKIGYYKVQIGLTGIQVTHNSCTCDSISRSCEHETAVVFALRKELDLFPALTNSFPKFPATDETLRQQFYKMIFGDTEDIPMEEDFQLFTDTAKAILTAAEEDILAGKYHSALGNCFEVIRLAPQVDGIIHSVYHESQNMRAKRDYPEGEELIEKAFELVNRCLETTDEELLEQIMYDLRVETLRNCQSNKDLFPRWYALLEANSRTGNRQEKFNKLKTTFDKIEKEYPPSKHF